MEAEAVVFISSTAVVTGPAPRVCARHEVPRLLWEGVIGSGGALEKTRNLVSNDSKNWALL